MSLFSESGDQTSNAWEPLMCLANPPCFFVLAIPFPSFALLCDETTTGVPSIVWVYFLFATVADTQLYNHLHQQFTSTPSFITGSNMQLCGTPCLPTGATTNLKFQENGTLQAEVFYSLIYPVVCYYKCKEVV